MMTLLKSFFFFSSQVQEFRTGATRQNMETTHAKEETKRLRAQLGDLRGKLADLEARVSGSIVTKTTPLKAGSQIHS